MDIDTWLVGVDLDRAHRAPLERCAHMASKAGARLLLVHVSPPSDAPPNGAAGHDDPELEERRRELKMTVEELRRTNPGLALDIRAVRGEVAPALLDEADWAGADQIVIGTHLSERAPGGARSPGSVTLRVVDEAPMPVVVLRAPRTERHVHAPDVTAPLAESTTARDPLKELLSFHGRIRAAVQALDDVAERALTTGEVAAEPAADLVAFFTGPLVWHDIDEEESLLSRLQRADHPPRLERVLAQCTAAHRAMEGVVERLVPHLKTIVDGGRPDAGRLRTAAEKLRTHLGPHLRMEEQEVFPLARLLLDDKELRAIEAEIEARHAARRGPSSVQAGAASERP